MMASRLGSSKDTIPIFIGDDVTDENAFLTLRRGVTIRVKNESSARTAARYTLNNVEGVRRFLLWLTSLETKMRCESR
jgi:trehalose 6-phosphate phosphatase